jgi:hypothetical protein
VIDGATTVSNGAIDIREDRIDWFTDRPRRVAGDMSLKGFVSHWKAWGFAADPPNAAINADGTDAVVEISKPVRHGNEIRFSTKVIDGKLGKGSIGRASLFVDPSAGNLYQVNFSNNSYNPGTVYLYQTGGGQSVSSVAWFSYGASEGTVDTFQWTQDYAFTYGNPGSIQPGVIYQAARSVDADLGSQTTLSYNSSGPVFGPVTPGPAPNALSVMSDGSVPPNTLSIGASESGAPVFVAPAQPNLITNFTMSNTSLWLAFSQGPVQQGQVLDVQSIQGLQIAFPPGYSTATVNLDSRNNFTVNYS